MPDYRTRQISQLLGQAQPTSAPTPGARLLAEQRTSGAEAIRMQQLRGLLGKITKPVGPGAEQTLGIAQQFARPVPEAEQRHKLEATLYSLTAPTEQRERAQRLLSANYPDLYPPMKAVALRQSILSGSIAKISEQTAPPPSAQDFQMKEQAQAVLFGGGGTPESRAKAARYLGTNHKGEFPELSTFVKRRKFLLAEEKSRAARQKEAPTVLTPQQQEEVGQLEKHGLLNSSLPARQRAEIYKKLSRLNPEAYPVPRSEIDLINSIATGQIAKATEANEAGVIEIGLRELAEQERKQSIPARREISAGLSEQERTQKALNLGLSNYEKQQRANITEQLRLEGLYAWQARQKAIAGGKGDTRPEETRPAEQVFQPPRFPELVEQPPGARQAYREAVEYPVGEKQLETALRKGYRTPKAPAAKQDYSSFWR